MNKFLNQKMITWKGNITTTSNEISSSPDRSKLLCISRNVNEASVHFAPSLDCDECSYLTRESLSGNAGWCVADRPKRFPSQGEGGLVR